MSDEIKEECTCHRLGGYHPKCPIHGLVSGLKEPPSATTHVRQNELALIGEPPQGSHPDEWFPRAETWHLERLNWEAEVKQLRETVVGQRDRIQLLMALMDDDEMQVLSEHDGNQGAAPVTPKSETNQLINKWEQRLADYSRSTLDAYKIYAQELRLCLSDLRSLKFVSSPAGSSTASGSTKEGAAT